MSWFSSFLNAKDNPSAAEKQVGHWTDDLPITAERLNDVSQALANNNRPQVWRSDYFELTSANIGAKTHTFRHNLGARPDIVYFQVQARNPPANSNVKQGEVFISTTTSNSTLSVIFDAAEAKVMMYADQYVRTTFSPIPGPDNYFGGFFCRVVGVRF